ncbi:MAG: HIT family protein [Clostridia bacterium]|nr:HIT family protein [Clostridia bacterium]
MQNLKGLSEKELEELVIKGEVKMPDLVDNGICPTCFNREHNDCLYGDNTDKILYEDEDIECFLVGNPRAKGHTVISSKKHYKDMMDISDDLCNKVFVFAKKMMNILKEVYGSESVYLCTMCDGPMNHFHIQLIPRYDFEKRGSKNFVKERQEYVYDENKVKRIKEMI